VSGRRLRGLLSSVIFSWYVMPFPHCIIVTLWLGTGALTCSRSQEFCIRTERKATAQGSCSRSLPVKKR
jgi:hypothetical protein